MKKINKAKYVVELVDNLTGRAYWAGDGDSYPTKSSAQALADKYPKRYTARAIKLTASSENPYVLPNLVDLSFKVAVTAEETYEWANEEATLERNYGTT